MTHQPYSPIVQSVEHLTVNQGVVGSSPTRGAKKIQLRALLEAFSFILAKWERLCYNKGNLIIR